VLGQKKEGRKTASWARLRLFISLDGVAEGGGELLIIFCYRRKGPMTPYPRGGDLLLSRAEGEDLSFLDKKSSIAQPEREVKNSPDFCPLWGRERKKWFRDNTRKNRKIGRRIA